MTTRLKLHQADAPRSGSAPPVPGGPQLGDLLVSQGLVTPSQLRDALHAQQASTTYAPLGQILVERGVLTQRQLNSVLDRFQKRPRLGEVLVRAGVITEEQLARALQHQAETGLRLGAVLLKLNLVTAPGVKQALCTQLGVPFSRIGNGIVLAAQYPETADASDTVRTSATARRASRDGSAAVLPPPAPEPSPDGTGTDAPLRDPTVPLRSAYDALRREHQAVTRAYGELRDRYDALCRDRESITEAIEAVARHLKV